MAIDDHKNFAYSTVATAPSPATSGTSLVVAAGEGVKFPAVSFNATIWPVSVQPTTANAEIVRVTGVSTDTLTIVRAQEGTGARTVVVGDQIAATISNKTFEDIENTIISWNIVTGTSQQAVVQEGYVPNNGSLVTVTLPSTAPVGALVRIAGLGAGGWKLAQNASEKIYFGNLTTTTGTGGYLQSTQQQDCVSLVCVVADTEWKVVSSIGNITVV